MQRFFALIRIHNMPGHAKGETGGKFGPISGELKP